MIIPFGSGSYTLRSRPLSAQRMVNTYLVAAPPNAKTLAANIPSYGIKTFTTAGNGPIRGGLVVNDQLYVVSGNALFLVNSAGTATSLGTIPNTDRVSMVGDGTNVFVATAGDGYVYNGSSVAQITDADFPGASVAGFLDGYLLIIEPNSGRFWIAGPYTPTDWNALDFATAEGAPDDLVGMVVDHREVFLFGRETTEVWFNSGNADFPLERTPSGFMNVGLLSKYAVASTTDNSVYFVANDYTIRRLDGYTPVIISTDAITQAIEGYEDKSCYACSFMEGGHLMVSFTWPEGTWVYDSATKLWHERQSYGYDNWRPTFVVRAYGKLLVGDSQSNKIGESDPETFMEWDQPLVASCAAPAIADQNRLIRHRKLELVFEQGVGNSNAPDPQVMLQWSDDGGRTWSNEYQRSLGAVGQYKWRVIFPRLGAARDRVYRYSVSDAARRTLIQATLSAA